MDRALWKGNEAAAEAAVRAQLDFFAGYPITPSTEILEYLAWRLPSVGKTFIQAESELAAINMILGASACNGRCLTASSGPGVSLMTSGISYAARNRLPFVLINVLRWGPGMGNLVSGQSDYLKEVKGAGHGGYRNVVFAPSSIQELVDTVYESFDIAIGNRIGVVILIEAMLAQMIEKVVMPPFKDHIAPPNWGIDGSALRGLDLGSEFEDNAKSLIVYARLQETLQRWEAHSTDDADTVLIAFGLPARTCQEAVRVLRQGGHRVGLIRPITLWPFPFRAFDALSQAKRLVSVETNTVGQLVEDVALAAKKARLDIPVYCCEKGPGIPSVKEVVEDYHRIITGKVVEKF